MKLTLLYLIPCAVGCAVDDPVTDDPVAVEESTSTAESALGLGICMPTTTCGFEGSPDACGMKDDGCGGLMWCGPCDCGTTFTACEIELPVIAEATVTLPPNQILVVSTANLSSGGDSVLHLLTTSGAQIAMNDDISSTNHASRITWIAPPFVGTTVRIVARAKSASTTGTAMLYYLSSSAQINLSYPEHLVASSRAGDELQTAPLAATSAGTHVVYTMSGANITARATSSTSVSLALPSSGTTRYLVGRSALGAALPARLMRNDGGIAGHDPDGDGLGSNLESALGTCSSLSGTAYDRFGVGFACSLATDPRDTDGDGLRDDWEVRGRLDVSPALALSRWGADPRHKDLFVEVDYAQETAGEPEIAVTHDDVRQWADYFADRIGTLTSAQRTLHEASIRNPDGQVGVRLHVDSGVAAPSEAFAALHGNWGGHGVVPPDPDGGRMSPSAARAGFMATGRRGVFRYALRAMNGGGQTSGLSFVYGGAPRTAAHESGHTADLYHDGNYNNDLSINCKPNYPSVMNYAFDGSAVGFADGTGAPNLNSAALVEFHGADPATQGKFLDVLETVYDLEVDHATGDIDWNRDGVIAPSGELVEAYTNNRPGGWCEHTRANSSDPAGPNTTRTAPGLARLGARTFIFTGGNGSVGWMFTTSAMHCRVPTGEPCASFDWSGQIAGFDSDLGVDAVRLTATQELLVVGVSASHVTRWALIRGVSGNSPIVSPVRTLGEEAALDQPTLVIDETGLPVLFYRDATGALFYRYYDRSLDAWGSAVAVVDTSSQPVRMATTGAPGAALARPLDLSTTATAMHLAFAADAAGCMQLWYRGPGNHWVRPANKLRCARRRSRGPRSRGCPTRRTARSAAGCTWSTSRRATRPTRQTCASTRA